MVTKRKKRFAVKKNNSAGIRQLFNFMKSNYEYNKCHDSRIRSLYIF